MFRPFIRGLSMVIRPPKDPLLVVIGSTGTGKSKLAVELALRHNGEIINGDAMQMYKGLPIITNKIPQDERNGIPHHLLDVIDFQEKPWTVTQFVRACTRIIDDIRSRGKLPILVGGTHYYTHALLFPDATLDDENDRPEKSEEEENEESRRWPILSASTQEIYAKLQEVDPAMAQRWHPNDRRKIQRSLEIWLQTGKRASELYAEQQQQGNESDGPRTPDTELNGEAGAPSITGGLRYPSLLFWLDSRDEALKQRLDKRVDAMVGGGLFEEAAALAKVEREMKADGMAVDKTKGIWVSIGYKEMQPWSEASLDQEKGTDMNSKLALDCIEAVKAGTRRYAKRQNRYIRIRLANALRKARAFDKLFLFDCSDLSQWQETVSNPAQTISDDFLQGISLPSASEQSSLAKETFEVIDRTLRPDLDRVARHCRDCNKVLMTEKEWQGHLQSRSHKKAVLSAKKRAEFEHKVS